jgi:hypothetical protein
MITFALVYPIPGLSILYPTISPPVPSTTVPSAVPFVNVNVWVAPTPSVKLIAVPVEAFADVVASLKLLASMLIT